MFDVGLGSHVCLAAGGQLANPFPILAGSLVVALQAADVAAFQQRRRGIRHSRYCLLDIGEGGVEPIEGAVCRGAVNQCVDARRVSLQDVVEIGYRFVVIPRRCGRLRPIDHHVEVVRLQGNRRSGCRIGSNRVAGQAPGLPSLVEDFGAQSSRRRYRLR